MNFRNGIENMRALKYEKYLGFDKTFLEGLFLFIEN